MEKQLSKLIVLKVHLAADKSAIAGNVAKQSNRVCSALSLMLEGEMVYTCGDQTVTMTPNNMIFTPQGSTYEWVCTKSARYLSFEFDSNIISDKLWQFQVINCEEIYKIYKQLIYTLSLRSGNYRLESAVNVYNIFLKMLGQQNGCVAEGNSQKLRPALEYIHSHFAEYISNDILAEKTGYSTPYFRKLFKETIGSSPIDYLKKLRIEKAKEMLSGEFGSVGAVATSLGYLNIYDFSRDFKKRVGVSPLKYAKSR